MPPITLSSLAPEVLQRLEENPQNPIFWSLQNEVYPSLSWAMSEAALITGEPEIRQSSLFTLAANTTVFTAPAGCLALLRIQAPQWIPKTTVWDMDRCLPGWESDTGDNPDYWFPIGLTQFAIHPQLNASVQAYLTYIALPVTAPRPYTGNEVVDFQAEFQEAFIDYSAHILTAKEGGEEFIQSAKLYDRFLSKMTELSNFAYRKGSLRFTRTVGAPASVSPVEKR